VTNTTLSFSPDSQYVAADGLGVLRMSDGNLQFTIKGAYSTFSQDGEYLAVNDDGIYRMSDGYKLISLPDGASFSPDGQYAGVDTDGVYRLNDGKKLFDIEGLGTHFSSDGAYIVVGSLLSDSFYDGVYRIRDGHRFPDLKLLNVPLGIVAVKNTVMVIEPT
jgi:WD40 repeat protein